jgi:hypothetical protein
MEWAIPFSAATSGKVRTETREGEDEELRVLKLKHISIQDYPNHKDISHIGTVVCDSAVVDDEGNSRVREKVIKKG